VESILLHRDLLLGDIGKWVLGALSHWSDYQLVLLGFYLTFRERSNRIKRKQV
jgi:uncharacterized iron-regulated membrane protein